MLRRWNIYVDGPMPSPIRDGDMVVDAVHDYLERTVTKEHFLGS